MLRIAVSMILGGLALVAGSSVSTGDEPAVRDLVARRNAAYHNLDAETLASLETPDFQIVDRFGDNIRSGGSDFNVRLWSWAFKYVYRGQPAPEHIIIGARFLTPDVAVVQSTNQWPSLTLDDGTVIPPHREVDTFTVVRRDGVWKIALQTIHNNFGEGVGDNPTFDEHPRIPGK